MKRRLSEFLETLRQAGLRISLAESIDAGAAVLISGIEPERFREAIAATVVKDQADRPVFDQAFDLFFAIPPSGRPKKKRSRQAGTSGVGSGGSEGDGISASTRPQAPTEERSHRATSTPETEDVRSPSTSCPRGDLRMRRKAILNRTFRDMPPEHVDDCVLLAEMLSRQLWAHKRRRRQRRRRGTLDLRRMLRRSTATGGVPMEPLFRARRPGRIDLIALCDVSHSCAAASEFLWALLRPAELHFRRVRLFAYVDYPVEVEIRDGLVLPESPIDYFARSDFGAVLDRLWRDHETLLNRNTLLLILGDARNNRRSARLDLLRRIQIGLRQVVWLNPEPMVHWNTGDSVIAQYGEACDQVLAADTPARLLQALERVSV